MSTSQPRTESQEMPLAWVGFDDAPIEFANRFLVQHGPHEFVLTLGQVTGPPPVGTPDQLDARGGRAHVSILTLGRVGLTRHRLAELIALLRVELEEHDRALS
jgi:hypothetical protein